MDLCSPQLDIFFHFLRFHVIPSPLKDPELSTFNYVSHQPFSLSIHLTLHAIMPISKKDRVRSLRPLESHSQGLDLTYFAENQGAQEG
jgi:hypothetical protein